MSLPTGIDFGTTNSVVATHSGEGTAVVPIDTPPLDWKEHGFDKVLPSVLGVANGNVATFGWGAKQQGGNALHAVKRLFATEDTVTIGGIEVSVELAAAALFGRLRAGAAKEGGATLDKAVVTIPANSRGLARTRTKLCAGLAGIEVTMLLNEPTAAAMAHSLSVTNDERILVFDWGGGTLDVTVLDTIAGVFMERASKGIQKSGGIDLDKLLTRAMLPEIPGHESWSPTDWAVFALDVELAKVRLSTLEETSFQAPNGRQVTVTRSTLERAIAPKIEETRGPIEQCLRDLRIDAGAIDRVVLVGGSSKIPAVRRFVSELLRQDPTDGVDPMTAVAEGAAIAAAILADRLETDFMVTTEHALGTIALNDTRDLAFSVLIPRNHHLPAVAEGSYSPVRDNQEAVNIEVIEGDPEMPLDHPDNVVLKEWSVPIDGTRTRTEASFDIRYDYDAEGILHVTVTDHLTGTQLLNDDVSFGAQGDKAELVRIAKELRELLTTGRMPGVARPIAAAGTASLRGGEAVDPASVALVARVRGKIVPFVDDKDARRLEALCTELEGASADRPERHEALEAEARQFAYLY